MKKRLLLQNGSPVFAILFAALTICLLALPQKGNAQSYDSVKVFSTVGSTTWTVPAGVNFLKAEGWGGGGAGGAASSYAAGGGAGGSYAAASFTVAPANVLNITVGAGGTTVNGSTTVSGGASKVVLGIDKMVAVGGNSVSGSDTKAGVAAQTTGGVGDVKHYGGAGGNGDHSGTGLYRASGGGGSAAYSGGNGNAGGNAEILKRSYWPYVAYDATAGAAGGDPDGGGYAGAGGTGVAVSTWSEGPDSKPGVNYGGGGGGAVSAASSNKAGGSGAQGIVILYFNRVYVNAITGDCYSGCAYSCTPANGGGNVIPNNVTYTWTVTANDDVTGEVGNATAALSFTTGTLTNTSAADQAVVYTVTPHYQGQAFPTFTITVTVKRNAQIADQKDTICNGTELKLQSTDFTGTNNIPAGTKYQWTIVTNNPNITGQSANTTDSASFATGVLSQTQNTLQSLTYKVTTKVGSCPGSDFNITVAVRPDITVANQTPAAICSGAELTLPSTSFTGTNNIPTGTTYNWSVAANANVTGQKDSIKAAVFTTHALTNKTDIQQTLTYTVTPTAASCNGAPFTITVIVNPKPAIAAQTPSTICNNTALTLNSTDFTGTNNIPTGTTYTWTVAANTYITGQSDNSTAAASFTTGTLNNSTTTDQSLTYTVTPATAECTGDAFDITVKVAATLKPGTIEENVLVCTPGAADTLKSFTTNTEVSGGTGTTTYVWQKSADKLTWNDIAGATTNAYTPSYLDNVGTTYYRLKYSNDCGSVYSDTLSVSYPGNVYPGKLKVTSGTIDALYCAAAAVNVTFDTANVSIPSGSGCTIHWQTSTYNGGWLPYTDVATTSTYTLNTTLTTSTKVRYQLYLDGCTNVYASSNNDTMFRVKSDMTKNQISLDTSDVAIVLNYSACDTLPHLTTPAINLNNTAFPTDQYTVTLHSGLVRVGVGEYTVIWKLTSPCLDFLLFKQKVTVSYPACGGSFYAKDAEGNMYTTVRIGCDCWMAENLRSAKYSDNTAIADARYYDIKTANQTEYGNLYSWYSAVRVAEGDQAAVPTVQYGYVEGACPAHWGMPTVADYTRLLANVGAAAQLKEQLGSYWLSGYNGVTPGSGFKAKPAGYYDNTNYHYYNLLGEADFWTLDYESGSIHATCGCLSYSCPDFLFSQRIKGSGYSVRCIAKYRDGATVSAPELGTMSIDSITPTSLNVKVPIISTGGETPTATICAYTDNAYTQNAGCVAAPTIANDTISGTLIGLTENTTYYVRVIATNAGGSDTVKGSAATPKRCDYIPRTVCTVASIKSNERGTGTALDSVADHEGNYYDVVQIGTQCWLKENMRCKTSPKGLLTAGTVGSTSNKTPYYYNYNNSPYINTTVNIATWGRLYNWCAAIDTNKQDPAFTLPRRGICPEGWHLPSDAEWTTMEIAAGIGDFATLAGTGWRGDSATVLAGGCDWTYSTTGNDPGNYNNARRNATLFSVLPSGSYGGSFFSAGAYANFWSSTRDSGLYAYYRGLTYGKAEVSHYATTKYYGFSVRCLRD